MALSTIRELESGTSSSAACISVFHASLDAISWPIQSTVDSVGG